MTCFMCNKPLPKEQPKNNQFCSKKCQIEFLKADFKESDTFSAERFINDREQLQTAIRSY